MGFGDARHRITGRERTLVMIGTPRVTPANPKPGYHTSNGLTSAGDLNGCAAARGVAHIKSSQTIAIPPFTWMVWPFT